jgi:hypothetical protein
MKRTRIRLHALMILLLLSFSASIAAQKETAKENTAGLSEVIWRDPGDIASLNLLYGAGGEKHAPDPTGNYKFVAEDLEGTSPKFDVEDAQGVRWKVKVGQEPQSETAATRLLWAAGYFTDEDYYLPELKVNGVPKLHRGMSFVSADGTVHQARLERKSKEEKKIGTWGWFGNPFLNNRELNGLRVMMSLLNNWDLKEMNNSIYEVNGERRYLVSDLGATFGNTGGAISRSKSDPKDYASSKFIAKAEPDFADFVQNGKMKEVTKHIPRADAKWMGQLLAQLSPDQIRDAFRSAGYSPQEVDGFAKVIEARIAALNKL